MTDAELKALAEKATPGPWYSVGPPWLAQGQSPWVNAGSADPHRMSPVCDLAIQDEEWDGDPDGFVSKSFEDAAYIAACSPDRILALLARLSRAEARVKRLEEALRYIRVAPETPGRERSILSECREKAKDALSESAPARDERGET